MEHAQRVAVLPQTEQLRAMHTIIRDRNASRSDFTHYARRIIRLLLEEALSLLPFEEHGVTTPVGQTYHGLRRVPEVCGVSVVRAGESMEAELRELDPGMPIGKILIQRDKQTKLPRLYYQNLPADIADRHVLLLEPMLATGGSTLAALEVLREAGVPAEHTVLVNFLASPQGLERVRAAHPGLGIVTSSIEDGLSEQAFMLPGIGDFGDRFFGTDLPSTA
jgi:uracil phosphoribosyltransferase